MPKFKPGDRVKSKHTAGRSGVVISCTDAKLVIQPNGVRIARPCNYELEIAAPEPEPDALDWSYAEAERLYQAAVEAMSVYNQYIERKPTVNYLQGSTPAKW